MADAWHQPPSHWLPHLHPLQRYHLDQALYAKWQAQERRNQMAREQGRIVPPAPRAERVKGVEHLPQEKQDKFWALKAKLDAQRAAERESAG